MLQFHLWDGTSVVTHTLPFEAPRTMFNVKIGGARRCAAQSWPVARMARPARV